MLDRYLVINNGVRYTAWKSRSKVLLVLTLKWLFCLTVGIVSTAGLWKIDLGNAQVLEYRSEYLETNGKMIKRLTIIINHALYTCLGIATFYSIRKTNKALKCISKDVKTDLTKVSNSGKVKASKTVVLMVFCDFVFYLPMLMHLYMVLARGFQKHGWFPFFAHYFVFVSSVNNPIIYYSRTQRFRMALLKLLRDPCGSDEVFELRTLPKVVLPDEKPRQHRGFRKHTARNAAKVTKEIHEMQVHIGPADTAEGREVRGPERESASGVRSSTPVGDHPFAFVHWSAIDDVDPDAKYVQREVQVIVSNQPSSNKGKSSGDSARSQSLPKEKQRTTTGGGTRPQDSSYASSSDLTQESGLTVTSISEDSSVECYDTRLWARRAPTSRGSFETPVLLVSGCHHWLY